MVSPCSIADSFTKAVVRPTCWIHLTLVHVDTKEGAIQERFKKELKSTGLWLGYHM